MGVVWIRLIGDRASVRELAGRLAPHLKWSEYPLYIDEERTLIDRNRVALYATLVRKNPTPKTVTLDRYTRSDE